MDRRLFRPGRQAAQNAALPVKVDARRRENGRLTIGVDIPTKEETRTIMENVEGRWRPLLVTAIFTGMRASELRGLMWDDVDFRRKVVHVRQRANLWCEIGAPKSAAGDREIPMAPMVVDALRERLQALLGHSSIQMTFDRYGHLFPSLEDDHAKLAAGELSLVAEAGR